MGEEGGGGALETFRIYSLRFFPLLDYTVNSVTVSVICLEVNAKVLCCFKYIFSKQDLNYLIMIFKK